MRTAPHPATPVPAAALRGLRQRRRISQLGLSLRVGVSQRHLSCIETGRAQPSREMLQALLDVLDAPLAERNDTLLAAGYAPAYTRRTLADAELAPVRGALAHLLAAHDSAPALVMDDAWNLLQGNRGLQALMVLLGVPPQVLAGGLNFLRALLAPGGLAGPGRPAAGERRGLAARPARGGAQPGSARAVRRAAPAIAALPLPPDVA